MTKTKNIDKDLREELTDLVDEYFPKVKPKGGNKGRGEAIVIIGIALARFSSRLGELRGEVDKMKHPDTAWAGHKVNCDVCIALKDVLKLIDAMK